MSHSDPFSVLLIANRRHERRSSLQLSPRIVVVAAMSSNIGGATPQVTKTG